MQQSRIERGLVIADPWIGLLLQGRELWEMRSTRHASGPPLQRGGPPGGLLAAYVPNAAEQR